MIVTCPNCIANGWSVKPLAGTTPHVVVFRMPEQFGGLVHAGPDMWFASRAHRIERGEVELSEPMAAALAAGVDSVSVAMGQYAEMCDLLNARRAV